VPSRAGKETGNSKFSAAQAKGTPLLDEDGLLGLVQASVPFAQQEASAAPAPAPAPARVPAAAMYGADDGPSTSKAARPAAAAAVPVDPSAPCSPLDLRCTLIKCCHRPNHGMPCTTRKGILRCTQCCVILS
jgi:hypothetical protein